MEKQIEFKFIIVSAKDDTMTDNYNGIKQATEKAWIFTDIDEANQWIDMLKENKFWSCIEIKYLYGLLNNSKEKIR